MPGIDPTIALGFKTPDPTQQLSGLLNVANSAQTLQQNQQKTQQGAIDLQQRQGMLDYIKSGDALNPDGSLNQPKLMQNAAKFGDTGMQMANQFATAHKQVTEASSAWNKLGAEKQQLIGQGILSLQPNAPPDLVNKLFDAYDQQYKGEVGPVVGLLRSTYNSFASQGKAEEGRQTIVSLAKSALTPQTQQDMDSGSLSAIPTKEGTVLIQTKTGAATPQGEQVGQTLAPPNQVVTNAQGRVGVVNPAQVNYQEPQPGTPSTPPVNLPVGESPDTLKTWQGVRTKTNLAAAQVPEEQFNNNQIIKLTKTANMGSAGTLLRGLTGQYAAAPEMITTNGTVDYDKLQHFLSLQQGALAERAGFNSDASRSIAEHQSGSADGTPQGVASIARTNRALSTGIDLYNRGQENWIKSNGNDPFKARDWQQAWSHTVDFDALRMYDAAKNAKADPEGIAAVAHELGGVKSERYQSALKKYDQMLNLIRSGGK